MLQVKRQFQITFLHSELLGRIPRVVHAFSTRRSERNDFTLGTGAANALEEMNRIRFLSSIGMPGWPLLKLKQVHSGVVVEIDDRSVPTSPPEADAVITSMEGVLVGVQTADCVPILLADAEHRAVAAVHAGWRGTVARIAEATVTGLREKFDSSSNRLAVAIGPHIGVCCYEVGEEVVDAIGDPAFIERRPEWAKPHLNLGEANRRQLIRAGIPEEQIDISSMCTRCRADLFFSFRREGKKTGHLLSVIGVTP